MQPLAPLPLSSGDLIADRRFEWARGAMADGDFAGAADVLTQALELVPGYAAGWFALGEARVKIGDRAGAVLAFDRACAVDPADRHGAALQLTLLGAATPATPPAYVRAVFDQYAPAFDKALVEGLSYRAPQLLLDAVKVARVPMKFGTVLDLGCGTGLTGVAFRPYCDFLIGIDVSGGMIAQAKAKGAYDKLIEAEIGAFLASEAPSTYHLVLAGDVFVYVAYLGPLFAATARAMKDGALFAFTAETHDGEGVLLRDTLRYAHGEAHVRAALDEAKLALVSLETASTRTEKGEPVPGLIVVAAK